MKNVLKILARDIMRLVKAPAALVVVVVLVILPSAYTWYNVIGFWNPYDNTGKLRVCVVDEDAGAENDLVGSIDVGEMIVSELGENDQLDWQFVDKQTAMDEVESGASYAAFVIPQDFSRKLLTITTADFEQPSIEYYVNEKVGPVVPKITDTGATTLDDTVNAAFVSTVSNVIAEKFDESLKASEDKLADSRSQAAAEITEAMQACEDAKAAIAEARSVTTGATEKLGNAEAAVGNVKQGIASARSSLADLAGLADSTSSAIDSLASAIAATEAASSLEQALDEFRATAPGDIPSFLDEKERALAAAKARLQEGAQGALTSLASAEARATAALDAQEALADELASVLGRAKATAGTATAALDSSASLVGSLEEALQTVYDDVMSLEGATVITDLLGEDGLDAAVFADFMAAPTRIVTEKLYPLGSYGSAMAPLFMNLTLWIGAFMLMVVLRQEADGAGIKNLTSSQRYLGRFALFAILVVLQALVCCAGLVAIGVHPVSVGALMFASAVASLAYLSIIYALSVTLQHLGMGICVMLVFLQIPGATGLYPLEMTPEFFQAVYPLFPFTYGINAMREAICGFYGMQYAQDVGMLALFFALSLALGLIFRPLLANVNRMAAREIRDSGIFNGEEGEIPARRYRFYQIMRALSNQPEYREALERRKQRLDKIYPSLIKWTAIVGVAVPVALTFVLTLTAAEKVIVLTLWLAWVIGIFVFLVAVENLRFSLERQLRLYKMDEGKLRGLYQSQHAVSDQGQSSEPEKPGEPPVDEPPVGELPTDAPPADGPLPPRGAEAPLPPEQRERVAVPGVGEDVPAFAAPYPMPPHVGAPAAFVPRPVPPYAHSHPHVPISAYPSVAPMPMPMPMSAHDAPEPDVLPVIDLTPQVSAASSDEVLRAVMPRGPEGDVCVLLYANDDVRASSEPAASSDAEPAIKVSAGSYVVHLDVLDGGDER